MAITAYTGVPGAGKSYALIAQVIVPAVLQGRRVLTNIGGVDPQKVQDYCAKKNNNSELGEVILFEGHQAEKDGFFPTEATGDADTFVKGGDMIVFDEWRLTFPNRGNITNKQLEPFLRWHRHLTNSKGVACDLAIGTQLLTDIHRDFRGLVERSYKFRKLKSVGLPKFFAWDAFDGHLQPKGGSYTSGKGIYRKEIFALYKSYSGEADGLELQTDQRTSIIGKGLFGLIAGVILMACIGLYGAYSFFTSNDKPPVSAFSGPATSVLGTTMATAPGGIVRPVSPFKIAGQIVVDGQTKIVLIDQAGSLHYVGPAGFNFDNGRPSSGVIDGQTVLRAEVTSSPDPAPRMGFSL